MNENRVLEVAINKRTARLGVLREDYAGWFDNRPRHVTLCPTVFTIAGLFGSGGVVERR
ncbi:MULTISPECIES: hypothetical protein [unclassified Streptomyces]|uniref:hypothetical protein n=1 Tax=unclassified Streptomyces TaxID=2593676 RepID=UPI001F04D70B|nr:MULTISPECIES: hypothetical protein [unclassified Streptomyces]MCH0566449.1 hypothetical protein [Streptomyces sp. MUM 2J]MCH0571841.1 hypothetical protein [Streptomyces sp. MUM 136J]